MSSSQMSRCSFEDQQLYCVLRACAVRSLTLTVLQYLGLDFFFFLPCVAVDERDASRSMFTSFVFLHLFQLWQILHVQLLLLRASTLQSLLIGFVKHLEAVCYY
ncbi:hypothetical protein B0H21DRAFT_733981 [Amylocystis lapponica]|nr:hypothetical protein B0H21DRAFT_733981 [Amylocystis lapponica]